MYGFVRKKVWLFALCLSLLAMSLPASAAGLHGRFTPLNPAFLEYQKALEKGAFRQASSTSGVFPGPIDFSYLKDAKIGAPFFDRPTLRRAASLSTLPPKFDLVAEGRVTPVVNQGGWGTCWAFAAMESVESSLLSATETTYDLSELNLAWFMYADESPEKPAYKSSIPAGDAEHNPIFDNGGYLALEQPTALFSRGTGPLYDTDAPYPHMDRKDPRWKTWVPNPLPYGSARFRLKEALRFSGTDDIKRALMGIGGLSISFTVTDIYMSHLAGVIYSPPGGAIDPQGGHAVMLVGWDDDYPKENFAATPAGIQPSADGAWKIQNSWGTAVGDHGYYWISYEDVTVLRGGGAVGFVMETIDSYDGIYFHDPLGMCRTWEIPEGTETFAANAFTATRDEKIVEVSFMTANTNMRYAIQVHRNLDESGNPGTGAAAFTSPQTGTAGATGYYSVRLDEPVSVKKGERFAIEIRLAMTAASSPADKLLLPVEAAVERYSDKVTVHPGESWFFDDDDGTWADAYYLETSMDDSKPLAPAAEADSPLPLFNLCIKAFTVAEGQPAGGSSSGCTAGGPGLIGLALAVYLPLRKRRA